MWASAAVWCIIYMVIVPYAKGFEMISLKETTKQQITHSKDRRVRLIYTRLIAEGVDMLEAYDKAHHAVYDNKTIGKQWSVAEYALVFVGCLIALA
jgi:hypothetical protein